MTYCNAVLSSKDVECDTMQHFSFYNLFDIIAVATQLHLASRVLQACLRIDVIVATGLRRLLAEACRISRQRCAICRCTTGFLELVLHWPDRLLHQRAVWTFQQ